MTVARYVLGGVVAVALAASTFLALRAAPVGFDQRGAELEHLSGLIPNARRSFTSGSIASRATGSAER